MANFESLTSATNSQFYADFAAMGKLRGISHENPDLALDEVAQQFESIFINQMLKTMRESLPKDGLLSSDQINTFTDMLDQQLSLQLSNVNGGIGIADMMKRQLGGSP
jgi:peptidoglycan hydrolase FlgJ